MSVIGVLYSGSEDLFRAEIAALRDGLADGGRVDGKNAILEVRSADGDFTRLASLAEDLVGRRRGGDRLGEQRGGSSGG